MDMRSESKRLIDFCSTVALNGFSSLLVIHFSSLPTCWSAISHQIWSVRCFYLFCRCFFKHSFLFCLSQLLTLIFFAISAVDADLLFLCRLRQLSYSKETTHNQLSEWLKRQNLKNTSENILTLLFSVVQENDRVTCVLYTLSVSPSDFHCDLDSDQRGREKTRRFIERLQTWACEFQFGSQSLIHHFVSFLGFQLSGESCLIEQQEICYRYRMIRILAIQ